MKPAFVSLISIAITLLFSACGGGGGNSDSHPAKATLSATPTSIELIAESATAVLVTVTNTSSSITATAVSAALPSSWSDVQQDASGCISLPPQAHCTLSFTPGNASHSATTFSIVGQSAEPTGLTLVVNPFTGAHIEAITATIVSLSTNSSVTIGVHNTSTTLTATHIAADLHGTPLPNALTQDASNCVSVGPGASCFLHFTANNTAVTQTSFPIYGDNTNRLGGAIGVAVSNSATITVAGSPLILQGTTGTPSSGTLTITNNSTLLTATNISADLASTALAGQLLQDASNCASVLPGASCTLLFTPGSSAVAATPVIIQGSNTSLVGANIAINAAPQITLSVSGSPLTLLPSGTPGTLTITNTSSTEVALNIAADFTGGALAGNVAESGNNCSQLVPADTCTLTFTPGSTLVPQTAFVIAGTNTQTTSAEIIIRALVIGDAYAGGIVFVLPAGGNPGKIVSTDETSLVWDSNDGTVGPAAQDNDDGASNTAAAVTAIGAGITYAPGYCDGYSKVDAGVTYDDWYLPAANELNVLLQQTTLHSGPISGFGTLPYWSSTESSGVSQEAGIEDFNSSGFQLKSTAGSIARCIRTFTP